MTAYRYLPGAREDLNKAAAFYQASVPGLGDAFLDDVERAIDDIRENPRIGAPIGRAFRRAVLSPVSIHHRVRRAWRRNCHRRNRS